jgi:hypothetical protein
MTWIWTLLGIVLPAGLEFLAKMLRRNSFKPMRETIRRDNVTTELENLKQELRLLRSEIKEKNGSKK